jgi:uncharacterized membrane protein
MAATPGGWSDQDLEQIVGNLLRVGVLISAVVVGVGGLWSLWQHGMEPRPDYHQFNENAMPELRTFTGILKLLAAGRGRAIIQVGLLLLIATPVARVVFCFVGFARERDKTYVVVTLIVLAVLVYGLFGESPG